MVEFEKDKMTDEEQKAVNRANDIINYCLNIYSPKFTERQFYSNMYHSYDDLLRLKQWWQTKFAHPFPFFTIETKSSFYYEGVFGQTAQGIWQVHPWDQVSIESARKITKLLKYQEDRSNFVKNFYVGSKGLGIYGDWFLETYWEQKIRYVQQPTQFKIGFDGVIDRPLYRQEEIISSPTPGIESMFQPQKLGFVPVKGQKIPITEKSQPDAQTLYINSVWIDPKVSDIENARFICVRREIPFNTLKQQEFESARYINVDMLKGTQMPKVPANYYDTELYSPFVKNTPSSNGTTRCPVDDENQMVEVIDIIYPATGEVESLGNRSIYLGRVKPYLNVNNPLVHIKNFEELGKLHGASDFRAIAGHWKLVNQYQSMEADNIQMHFRGYTKVARDAGEGVKEAYESLRPGSVIQMNNLGGATHDRPDIFSPLVTQSKNELISQALQTMGQSEILSGATPSSNVRSAGQQAQLANFGAKILSQGIRNISQGLKTLGEKWLTLDYEKLDPDLTIPILGQGGEEIIKINPGDIPIFANISVRLSADLEAQKDQKLQQMLQAINLAQASVPGYNTAKSIKDWFRIQGSFDNPDQYFLIPDDVSTALTLQQFGLGADGRPQNLPQNPALAGATAPPNPNQVTQGNNNSGNANIPNL